GDELDAAELRPDHAVDGVAAATTDTDDFDTGVPLQGPVDVAHGFLLVALQARPYEPFGRHPRSLAPTVITRDHGPRGEALHSKLIVDVHIGLLPLEEILDPTNGPRVHRRSARANGRVAVAVVPKFCSPAQQSHGGRVGGPAHLVAHPDGLRRRADPDRKVE